jgi:deferrochelatase/peroxidase EfeB
VSESINLKDVQGNILRGYKSSLVRHVMLEVTDPVAARRFLRISATGGGENIPAITNENPLNETWDRPDACFNIGLTFEGLLALGAPQQALASFPAEFIEGMAKRAMKIGDFGESAPSRWAKPFDNPKRLHLIASLCADDARHLDRTEAQLTQAFTVLGTRDGRDLPDKKVFFDYTDSISQPRFREVHEDDPGQGKDDSQGTSSDEPDNQPFDPLGTILLGHPTRLEGLIFRGPSPTVLGHNGTFNAFRILEQHVTVFEDYLDAAAQELLDKLPADAVLLPGDELLIGEMMGRPFTRKEALREFIAAQFCGRWRDKPGTPVALAPDVPKAGLSIINFNYDAASRCPVGAHIRRSNPRGGQMVQRISNYTRRLVRRGKVYGPDFDRMRPDNHERGLLGNFIGASLSAQFEAIMCDWVNLGLHDPDITGSNDPLIGANITETSWFDLSLRDRKTYRLRGFPRLVTTRGGAYTFLPSLPAIRYLGDL